MPPKRPKYSRFGRLPGVHRITERRIPGPEADLERLTLYLPGGILDRAMTLAQRSGAESLQMFCEDLLRSAIEAAQADVQTQESDSPRITLLGFDAITNDEDYLAEWSASVQPPPEPRNPALEPPRSNLASPTREGSAAEEVVLRHAGLQADDPSGLLATLRRGETINPAAARELLQALVELESEYRGVPQLDRRLSYALHRIAFEGQILLTDAFPGLAGDTTTLEILRMVQEGTDRVLSGEDIRYYSEGTSRDASSWPDDDRA